MKNKLSLFLLCLITFGSLSFAENLSERRPPNVIVFFIDDMGYGDIGPYGSETPTPHLDRLAAEGRTFTDFIVASPVCSSSRASLLTGSFSVRAGVNHVYFPKDDVGLSPAEVTIAELCKNRGYATACFGKWHLGHHPKFLPLNHGFDEFWGIPYSNDMWPENPAHVENPEKGTWDEYMHFPDLPLIEGDEIIKLKADERDQAMFTKRITEKAVDFIGRNRGNPFFLYLPHPMVHVPLYVSDEFEDKTGQGLYADVVAELDWSVGEIIQTLHEYELDENTLVLFTSDNGPWLAYGDHAGVTGGLREGKQTAFAGGMRVPGIFWWPSQIPAGTRTDSLASTIDLLPTVASLIGAELPENKIDGHDISEILFSESAVASPHVAFPIFHMRNRLLGIRNERFKLIFEHRYRTLGERSGGVDGERVDYDFVNAEYALYDLENDIAETENVMDRFPQVVRQLETIADYYRETLGDASRGMIGTENRAEGVLTPGDRRLWD